MKQEKPGMDDFEEKKNFGSKEKSRYFKKILRKISKFLTDTFTKCNKIFLHILFFKTF